MSNIIKHKDIFWGEIKLKEVAKVSISFENTITYYILEQESNKTKLKDGIWYKDKDGLIQHMTGNQVETIHRIYDKITRIF